MSGTLHRHDDDPAIPQGWRRTTTRDDRARDCDHMDASRVGMSTWVCPDCSLTWRSEQ